MIIDMREQTPVKCDHCGKTFKSGAGVALHMRHVNGEWVRGDYSPEGLESRRDSIKKVQKLSPSGSKSGQRFLKTCLREECCNTFEVVESKIDTRKYCSKQCSGIANADNAPIPTEEQRILQSERMKKRYADNPESNPFYGRTPTNYRGWGKGGFCEELGYHIRSTWERDYLISLKEAGILFEYEPKRFPLPNGEGTYLPDVHLTGTNVYIEITGWDKPGKEIKRNRFAEVYDVVLHVVNERPTKDTMQNLVKFCEGVMQPNDNSAS